MHRPHPEKYKNLFFKEGFRFKVHILTLSHLAKKSTARTGTLRFLGPDTVSDQTTDNGCYK